MNSCPLRTSVVGSYPFPGWLEFASQNLDRFGPKDIEELQEDAVIAAVHDQTAAGLDVITDGEQTRLDFNLSFYGHIQGISLESTPPRRWGPPRTTNGAVMKFKANSELRKGSDVSKSSSDSNASLSCRSDAQGQASPGPTR